MIFTGPEPYIFTPIRFKPQAKPTMKYEFLRDHPSEARKLAEEAKRLWRSYAIYYANYRSEPGFENRDENRTKLAEAEDAIDRLVSLSPAPTPEDRAVASHAVEALRDALNDWQADDNRVNALLLASAAHAFLVATPSQPELLEDREGQAVALSGEVKQLREALEIHSEVEVIERDGTAGRCVCDLRVGYTPMVGDRLYLIRAAIDSALSGAETRQPESESQEQAPVAEALETARKALMQLARAANARGFDVMDNSHSQRYWYTLRDQGYAAIDRIDALRSSTRKSADEGQKEQAVASQTTGAQE